MIMLNFAEPLTEEAVSAISALSGRTVRRVVNLPPKFADNLPLVPQVRTLLDQAGFSKREWETTSLVVCLPNDPAAAALIVAEVAGRRGRTPSIVRFIHEGPTGKKEPSEIISLHEVRKEARQSGKGWIPPATKNGGF